jgi:PAS domain S-box-containing protein
MDNNQANPKAHEKTPSRPLLTGPGWVLRYGLAVGAVAVAMGLRQALTAWVGPGLPPYITFYPTVMVVALLGGFGPGLLATALTGLVVSFWLLPPVGHFAIASPLDRLGLVIFIGMGVFVSVVADLYRRHRHKAAAYDREAALRESQARLATFAAATFEGIVESEGGRIVDCNEQAERMLGYTLAELRGMEIVNLVAPGDRDRVVESIQQGRESTIEHVILRKDGTRIEVEAHGQPLFPNSATRLTALRDITERKRAEQALRENRERLDLALASARMATFDWDIVKNKRTWSEGVHALLGTKSETFTGTAEEFFQIIHPEDRSTVQSALARAVEASGDYEIEYRAVWPDGSVHHIAARGKVHHDNAGRAVQMTGVCWDITERKRAEMELQRRAEELRAANEELTRFNRVTVGRELRIIELKKQVNDLCARLSQPPRYATEPDEAARPAQ